MTETPNQLDIQPFGSAAEQRAATIQITDKMLKVLFFYLEEKEGEEIETEGGLVDFVDFLWDVVGAAVAASGMRVIGRDSDGRYIASFEPTQSTKEFLISTGMGLDGHVYYEDYLPDIGPYAHFGAFDGQIFGKSG